MRFWPAQRQLTTMASPAREPERIAALDGVRGVAILLVLVMHGLYIGPFVEHAFLLSKLLLDALVPDVPAAALEAMAQQRKLVSG